MTITEKSLAELIHELPPNLHGQVRDFVEFLLEKQRRVEPPEARGWPSGYFERSAGSLPDFPDVDSDMSGIDPTLDETEEELRFDREFARVSGLQLEDWEAAP
jgi:hypothetical protein